VYIHSSLKIVCENTMPYQSITSCITYNCNNSLILIAHDMFLETFTHGVCLFSVCRGDQHNYGHMSVSYRMFVSININKTERVGCSDGKGSMYTRRWKQN